MHEVRSFSGGAFGGVCLALAGNPLDLVKTNQQAQHCGAGKVMASVLRHEGLRGFWRGAGTCALGNIPVFGMVYWSHDLSRRLVARASGNTRGPASVGEVALAGSLVAFPVSLVWTPFELVKNKLQIQGTRVAAGHPAKYKGMLHCARQQMRSGPFGLYKGWLMILCRDVPGWSAYFFTYHYVKLALSPPDSQGVLNGAVKLSPAATCAAGAMAGVAGWVFSYPADVVKCQWQTGDYKNYSQVIRRMVRAGGLGSFYSGIGATIASVALRDSACFSGVELVNRLFYLGTQWAG